MYNIFRNEESFENGKGSLFTTLKYILNSNYKKKYWLVLQFCKHYF